MSEESNTPKIEVTQSLRDTYKQQKMLKMLTDEITQLQSHVNSIVAVSQQYDSEIKQAKTKPKRDLFSKKLKKNNIMLYQVLRRLDQSIQVHELAKQETENNNVN